MFCFLCFVFATMIHLFIYLFILDLPSQTRNQARTRILPKKLESTFKCFVTTLGRAYSHYSHEAQERHVQRNALIDQYKKNADSENVAHLKGNLDCWRELTLSCSKNVLITNFTRQGKRNI